MSSIANVAFRGLLELLAPERCAACDAPLTTPRAGVPAGPEGFCGGCGPLLERAPRAGSLGAAFVYGGPLADAIRRYKYGGRSELAGPLGRLLASACLELAGRVELVVPVPLHAARLRARGFDQAALLTGPIARGLGASRLVDGLARVRPTAVQASLARERRVDNVRGAFAPSPRVRGARVLVVDDVRTTGATLGEACAALVEGGAAAVHALALAGVEPGHEALEAP